MEIRKEDIQVIDSINNWKESIVVAAKPLLERGAIEESYIDAMITSIEKLGFYVVLTDGVAMPHSRPEDGVLESCFSLLKVKEGVLYGEREVRIIFILGAKDNNSHVEFLTNLADLLNDDEKIESLFKEDSIEGLYEILNS